MICPKCGKKIGDGSKFCNGCGVRLESERRVIDDVERTTRLPHLNPQPQPSGVRPKRMETIPPKHGATPVAPTAKNTSATKKKNPLRVLFLVFGIVLIIALLLVSFILWQRSKKEAAVGAAEIKGQQTQEHLQFGGHSYALFNVNKKVASSWDAAKKYCEKQGGYLSIINTAEENKALFDYVREKGDGYAFFGYSDELSEGAWLWVDGEENSGYTNWGVDSNGNAEPNADSAKEDYAEFTVDRKDASWNDAAFGQDTYVFLCEWDTMSESQVGK